MLAFISRKVNWQAHYGIYFKYECLEYALITSSISSFHFDAVTGQISQLFSPAMPISPFLEIIKLNQHFYILNLVISELRPYLKQIQSP